MHQLVGYHRPGSVRDAVALLATSNRMALGGGTTIRHELDGTPVELVDLQSLGLDAIDVDGDRIRLGAMVTLQAVVDSGDVPAGAARAAAFELQSTLRTLATVGGTVGAADPDSVLLAALLVHEATVHFADGRTTALEDVLDGERAAGDLIVAVEVTAGGTVAIERTGRTPGDVPIVAAVARRSDAGTRVALTGIAATPRVVEAAELDRLEPPDDFRGTADYRRHLARVLFARALAVVS